MHNKYIFAHCFLQDQIQQGLRGGNAASLSARSLFSASC